MRTGIMRGLPRAAAWISVALASAVLAATCKAQETTTYTYDARGRVTGVTRSGGPVSGATTTYTYDKTDNRSNVTVVSSPNGSGSGGGNGATATTLTLVVVPLNGFTLIAFPQ